MKKIFLYGPPGSGKSTVGKEVAICLGVDFLDLDAAIEQKAGRSLAEIMTGQGEPAFRELETAALRGAVAGPAGVIALGGGTLLRSENQALAESAGEVVCLDAGLETLTARLCASGEVRPLLAGDLRKNLAALLEKRREHYRAFALQIKTGPLDPGQAAREVQTALGRFRVRGMGPDYDVVVEPGGLDLLGGLLREHAPEGPLVLVADENVGPLYAERAAASLRRADYRVQVAIHPAGERAKTLETAAGMWRAFLQAGLERRSTVVALGGGVTGDLAGFAAASFLRGISWVAVPTSLLAMVDASLGGKTGVDLPEGKNLVGAFHPPRLVLADPQTLGSLPEAELRSGLAEVVKHGVLADPALFAACAEGFEAVKSDLAGLVRRAMAVKIAFVQADPYEKGERMVLNLGHTVGHALEVVSGYRMRHGEAVAVGMVVEARLAERLGLAPAGLSGRIAAVLAGLGLPVEVPSGLSHHALVRAMGVDKKKSAGAVRFTLPLAIGKVQAGVTFEDLNGIFV
jgi:shikimate kinase/3-dehydroquinate synthase